MLRRWWVYVPIVLTSMAVMPARAAASPANPKQVPECACTVFARYMDGSKALRREWNRFVDSNSKTRGMRGNHIAAVGIKGRIKRYAENTKADQEKACKANEFMRKVCRAAKACVVAAAATLYGALQAGDDFWKAERAALVACEVAIVTVFFAG
jgi:hypothetical protein